MTCCQWAVGHCQVPPPLCPLQAETTVVGSQQGLRCGSICPVTTGQESVVNRCATNPHSVQISHPRRQGPSTQETILSDHPQQRTVLPRCCLSGSPWRLAWHQRSTGSMPFEYAVDGSTSQTHTGSNSTLVLIVISPLFLYVCVAVDTKLFLYLLFLLALVKLHCQICYSMFEVSHPHCLAMNYWITDSSRNIYNP